MIRPGYRFGMRQPATRIRLVFSLPAQLSFHDLDVWIQEALESDVKDYQPIFIGNQSTDTPQEKYLIRLLYVTTILLQDIRVPVFERAAIVQIEVNRKQPDAYLAEIWFPIVEAFPIDGFHAWICIANELIANLCQLITNPSALEDLYQTFQKKYVLPWSRRIPGAKSTIPILQAAFELGIPFAHLASGRYILGWGCQSRLFERSINIFDSAIGAVATQNKDLALAIMHFAGIPVPKGRTCKVGESLSLATLKELKLPLVVKPVDKDRGEGVSLGIKTEEALQNAFQEVAKISRAALVEEQVAGTCHRILVVDGKVVYVVKRHPKGIIGDGMSSVEVLVKQMNDIIRKKIPLKRLPEIQLDAQAIDCLKEAGLDAHSVPKPGQKVPLRPAQSTVWGGDPEDVTQDLHPDNAEIAIRVAALFGLTCAGVDFISTDISIPWHQNGAVINEVNFAPVIGRTHAFQRNAARAYLDKIFPTKGKIPVEIFIGESNKQAAINRWYQLTGAGKNAFMCHEEAILKPNSKKLFLAGEQSNYECLTMLRADKNVDAIVVHCSDMNFFAYNGWPAEEVRIHNSVGARND
jgi:cyanophycin synthetase